MKTAISIPDDLFRQAEATGKRLGVSNSNLFSRAIQEFLELHNPINTTEKLNQVYQDDHSNVDAAILQLQIKSLDIDPLLLLLLLISLS